MKVGTYHDKPIGPEEYQGDVDKAASTDHDAFEKEAMNKAADEAEAQEKATQQQNDQHQPTAKGGADNQQAKSNAEVDQKPSAKVTETVEKQDVVQPQHTPDVQVHSGMPLHSQMRELSLDLEKAYEETGNIGVALNKVLKLHKLCKKVCVLMVWKVNILIKMWKRLLNVCSMKPLGRRFWRNARFCNKINISLIHNIRQNLMS